jgi:SAM-dependent methyltransferase
MWDGCWLARRPQRGAMTAARGPCPVCENERFVPASAAVGHRFERCHACGFVRMQDAPTAAGLADFYAQDTASCTSAQQDHAANLQRFDGILRTIERHGARGRLLDVGCSIGTSLVVARQRGWHAVGLELSRPAAQFARTAHGVDVRTATLETADFAPGSFDAVLMHHTLEHVAAPDRVLQQVFAVLAPDGVMYQSLPNHGSLKARLLGPHFGYGITEEHLSHFSVRTLRRLVQRIGFRVLATSTWSYRQDPRLLWDFASRVGLRAWLARECGVRAGEPMDAATYVAFLARTRWAYAVCNHVWPARLCRWLRLGEDLHLVARRPR